MATVNVLPDDFVGPPAPGSSYSGSVGLKPGTYTVPTGFFAPGGSWGVISPQRQALDQATTQAIAKRTASSATPSAGVLAAVGVAVVLTIFLAGKLGGR